MVDRFQIDPVSVKRESEAHILAKGGKICDWLPFIEHTPVRSREALVGRIAVMIALLNIYFEAPIAIIKAWIERHKLTGALSASEQALLEKSNSDLTEQERIDLYWTIEAIWGLMWAGSMIEALPFDQPVEDRMASLLPNLQRNEDTSKLDLVRLRSYADLYRMRDLYYRVHWYARDGWLHRYNTEPVRLDVVMERRKALEWVMDERADWDQMNLST